MLLRRLLLLCVIPLAICGLTLLYFAGEPEKFEHTGLTIPRPEPREGYDIIFPGRVTMGIPDQGIFYYVSQKRQVIYRYDADRYLELQGENCEGLIWYHDDAQNIHTRIQETFFTAYKFPKFRYYNPGRNYIAIPTQDLTAVMFSIDGGKTFIKGKVPSYSAVSGDEVDRFIGVDDEPLTIKVLTKYINDQVTVSGNTGYFILKNGDVIFGETVRIFNKNPYYSEHQDFQIYPIRDESIRLGGNYSHIYSQPAYIKRIEKSKTIPVEPYQNWDRLRCEAGAER